MEFKKHEMKPGVKRMLEVAELNKHLLELLEDAKNTIEELDNHIVRHQARVRDLFQKPKDEVHREFLLLAGIKEFALLGFITKHVKRIDKMIEDMKHSNQNMMMYECVVDIKKEEKE